MSAQRYTQSIALERMQYGLCPECGNPPAAHNDSPLFWLRGARECSLLPQCVLDRLAQYRADIADGKR